MMPSMEKLARIRSFLQQVEQARRHYRAPRLDIHLRALVLRHRAKFSMQEMRLWGLLDQALAAAALPQHVSKRQFLKFQAAQSPTGHAALVEDKELFYRFCEAIALPIPDTVAFLSRTAVWFTRGPEPEGVARLRWLLQGLQGEELIIKPADGVYGNGVRALRVSEGGFVEDGRRFGLDELMLELPAGSRQVLQRRLFNHASVTALTGFSTLQTLRVVTGTPRQAGARARILSTTLRLSARDSVINNFHGGREGTVRAKVDMDSGRIVRAVRASPNGFGLEAVERVDSTGCLLPGVQLPHWEAMKALLEAKAACFYPIRFVGWDVALTQAGPVVLEGNLWFDPSDNAFAETRDFIDRSLAIG